MPILDDRSPNPPIGYSQGCRFTQEQQLSLVAEFHVNKIRPSRIAYRLGIDIDSVEAWLAGEKDQERFSEYLFRHRRLRYQAQIKQADKHRGQQAYELRAAAHRDLLPPKDR